MSIWAQPLILHCTADLAIEGVESSKVTTFKNPPKKAIPEYIRFRNESKGQWARYGKTASSVLKDAEAKLLTDEKREKVIRELFFEKVERTVKQNGKVKFDGKWYHVGRKMTGETVEMKVTLRGMDAWHNGAFVKRWKYWAYVLDIAADYMLSISHCLRS